MRINNFLSKVGLLILNILIILTTKNTNSKGSRKSEKQSKPHNLQNQTSAESSIVPNNKTKYNYMTLKLTKKSSSIFPSPAASASSESQGEYVQNAASSKANNNYIQKLSQQFFQLSDASKLNIKHLDISALTSLQNAIAIEPIKIRNYFNMQYYATLFVGASRQEFSVIIDTGSNLLWLPSSNCSLCRNYTNKYNESTSSTNKLLNKTINITYGKGFVEGDLFSDDVFIAENFGVKNMHFLSVDKELELDGTISDGLLGLGLYFENNKNFSFVYGLFQQGLINKNSSRIFSKYWACDVLSISTTNETFEKSNLDFLQDSNENYLYNSNNENTINDKISDSNNNYDTTLNSNFSAKTAATNYQFKTTSKAIFDTGSSLVFMPPNDFMNLIPYFSAKAQGGLCTLSYAFQIHCKCSSPRDFGSIYLNFATGKFVIDFESIIDYMPSSEYQCRFQIILDLFNFDTWILGDSVLRYSFITFDMEKREVSFLQNAGMITDSNIIGADKASNKNADDRLEGQSQKQQDWIFYYCVYFVVFCLAALFSYALYKCFSDKDDLNHSDDRQYHRLANN